MNDHDERPTIPPNELELTRVSEFETAARVNENDARLAELEKLRPFWVPND